MILPAKTSELLDFQEAARAELHVRFGDIFRKHRALAFAQRHDQLFNEHWTPEQAAAGYQFSGYEIDKGQVVLHGMETAADFIYRISIMFPLSLVDRPKELSDHLKERYALSRKAT